MLWRNIIRLRDRGYSSKQSRQGSMADARSRIRASFVDMSIRVTHGRVHTAYSWDLCKKLGPNQSLKKKISWAFFPINHPKRPSIRRFGTSFFRESPRYRNMGGMPAYRISRG